MAAPLKCMSLDGFAQAQASRKGVRLMKQIRRRRSFTPTTQRSMPIIDEFESERDVWQFFTEKEVQGMLMMYQYLHPEDHPLVDTREKGILMLNDVRRVVRTKMQPVEHLYLLDPFEEALTTIDLRKSLGKSRMLGALYVFDYLFPKEEEPPGRLDIQEQLAELLNGNRLPSFIIYLADRPVFIV